MNMAVYYGFVSGVSWLHILYLGFSPVFLHEMAGGLAPCNLLTCAQNWEYFGAITAQSPGSSN